MQRYTKVHDLVRHRARAGEDIAMRGKGFWDDPIRSLLDAIESAPRACDQALKSAMTLVGGRTSAQSASRSHEAWYHDKIGTNQMFFIFFAL